MCALGRWEWVGSLCAEYAPIGPPLQLVHQAQGACSRCSSAECAAAEDSDTATAPGLLICVAPDSGVFKFECVRSVRS